MTFPHLHRISPASRAGCCQSCAAPMYAGVGSRLFCSTLCKAVYAQLAEQAERIAASMLAPYDWPSALSLVAIIAPGPGKSTEAVGVVHVFCGGAIRVTGPFVSEAA